MISVVSASKEYLKQHFWVLNFGVFDTTTAVIKRSNQWGNSVLLKGCYLRKTAQ